MSQPPNEQEVCGTFTANNYIFIAIAAHETELLVARRLLLHGRAGVLPARTGVTNSMNGWVRLNSTLMQSMLNFSLN